MMTIVMMFAFPIGVMLFYYERKDRPKYQAIFDIFFEEVRSNTSLDNAQKIEHVKKMMLLNKYHITQKTATSITAERKLLSPGLLSMGLGTFMVGALVYLTYFYFIQKPHVISFTV